ncbi:MAG TPA: SDR family oxidoreductase [Candidatus Eisenbacteria bacterium]|nr:SDR family oxidoreductase [Candidatus Eisenbacteria bacterium]
MKVLVTGSDGYIGSQLGPYLIARGHDVVGLDTGFYREGWLYNNGFKQFPSCINKDVRLIEVDDLEGFDAVVHLAELSNDPLGQLNPEITYRLNHQGGFGFAKKCKEAGVARFIYSSSCSVYGTGSGDYKTETSETNPQTAYAECKLRMERDLQRLADDGFSPTFLRNATAYGASARMRFDLVLNNLAGWAWTQRQIKMTSDGTPWRPLVHVLDICEAMACCLEAPRDAVHDQIFNVGDTKANYQVKEIAEIVAGTFPGCTVEFGSSDGDNRSYRVSFDKIKTKLPGFRCRWDPVKGAEQLLTVFKRIGLTRSAFESRMFTRLKQIQYLIETHQLDGEFFWSAA